MVLACHKDQNENCLFLRFLSVVGIVLLKVLLEEDRGIIRTGNVY